MQNDKELTLCRKRFTELANAAYYKDYPAFSDFLSLNEQSLLLQMEQELSQVSLELWGGNQLAERKLVCFANQLPVHEEFPIQMIKICPAHAKFSEDLSHRDYLGAIMHLGIERSKIGDIMMDGKDAYVYAHETLASYICSSIEKVRHTNVKCSLVDEQIQFEQKYKEIIGTVSSIRLDAIIALAFQNSRSKLLSYISSGKVFVNGAMIESNSYRLREGDVVSVRGVGKFLYEEEQNMTKKGKIKILLRRYI